MKTEVAILHNEYPPELREYAEEKLRHLTRFNDRTISVRALLDRESVEHKAKLVASVRHGVVEEVEGRADSIRAALDEAIQRMGRVLSKHKDKLTQANRRGTRTQA